MAYNRWITYSDELYHHGVKGMKWGVRRFQSYATNPRKSGKTGKEVGQAKKQAAAISSSNTKKPSLSNDDKKKLENAKKMDRYELSFLEAIQNEEWEERNDKARRVKEYERYLLDRSSYMRGEPISYSGSKKNKVLDPNNRDHYDDSEFKKDLALLTAKIGVDVLTLSPVNLAYDTIAVGQTFYASAKTAKFDARTKKLEVDSSTGLKKKASGKDWTPEQDMKEVNPGFASALSNGSRNNCVLCSLTYDLRRRGYDVVAGKASYGYNERDLKHWYPGVEGKSQVVETTKQRFGTAPTKEQTQKYISGSIDTIKNTGEGARGTVFVKWKNSASGHALAYEVHNGQVDIYDCQSGKKQNPEKLLKQTSSMTAYRLDQIEPDPKYIKEVTRK